MYARMTTTPISPYRLEEVISLAQESTLPAASRQPGFKGYLLLVDRTAGVAITITFWLAEEDRQVSGPDSAYYKESISRLVPLLTGAPSVEDFEVALQA